MRGVLVVCNIQGSKRTQPPRCLAKVVYWGNGVGIRNTWACQPELRFGSHSFLREDRKDA